MQLTFCGAARAVTGSCTHVQLNQYELLVDCGLQLGQDVVDNKNFLFQPQRLDAVLLTHCHVDHCGRLPLLVRQGFGGPIYMTEPTARLLALMLRDGARLQESLFTLSDVEHTLGQIQICHYGQWQTLADDLRFCFYNAGHILGSATIALAYGERGEGRKLIFSGDLGNRRLPLVDDPQQPLGANYVVLESTHGDHCYWQQQDYQAALARALDATFQKQGTVLIPAAAVGRTQELLYYLQQIKQQRLTPACPDFPVYVDSELAREACAVYGADLSDCYLDAEARALKQRCSGLLDFPQLHFCSTRAQSCALNDDHTPKVIIAPGGLCDGGPIRHHLRHHLRQPQSTVILLGNPRRGTLARTLLDGAAQVSLLGHETAVQARIMALPVRPIHADQPALRQWVQRLTPAPWEIFLNHGDEDTALFLAASLGQLPAAVHVPRYGDSFTLR